MKYLLVMLLTVGCVSYPKTRISIVHDYIFQNGVRMCEPYAGLHYVVAIQEILAESSEGSESKDYPCSKIYSIRCQDGTLLTFRSEVTYCFIQEMQIQETLEGIE
jgi:hypothetical protein